MRAYRKVMLNKGSAGVDEMPVKELYAYLTKNRGANRIGCPRGEVSATTHPGSRD